MEQEDDPAYLVEREGGVLRLTFNRPQFGNAVPASAVLPLTAQFQAAAADETVRCILISGHGKNFSAGGNIAGFAEDIAKGPEFLKSSFEERLTRLAGLVRAVINFDKPIIAAVRGGVAGAGLLFALAADLVIADETAFFLFAHQLMGLTPDAGVSYLLPRAVGLRQAKRLVLTAARLDANEAKQIGLINRLVNPDMLQAEAAKAAAKFAKGPRRAVHAAKALLEASLEADLAMQLQAETRALVACVQDPDFAEGVQAFVERRPVRFPSATE